MATRRFNLIPTYKLHQSDGLPKLIESDSTVKRTTFSRRLPRHEESAQKQPLRNNNVFRSAIRNTSEQRNPSKIGQVPSTQLMELTAPPKLRTDSVIRHNYKIETEAKLKREEELRREEQKKEQLRRKEEQRRKEEIEKRAEQEHLKEAAKRREQQQKRQQEQQLLQQRRYEEKRLEQIRKLERERIAEAEKRQKELEQREQLKKEQIAKERRELEEKRLEDERKKYLERERERQEQARKEKEAKEREERQRKQRERKQQEQKERRIRQKEKEKDESSRKSALKIGLIGLNNIGNTCYLNSILQCLFNLPSFNTYFLNGKYQTDGKGFYRVADAYAKLISLIRNTVSKSESPSTLKSAVASRNYQFGGYKQQDANEFLVCLLDLLGEDLKLDYRMPSSLPETSILERVNEPLKQSRIAWEHHLEREHSHINSFFGGQFVSCISCTACKKTAQSFDPFWDIQLSFSKHKKDDDLVAMVEAFAAREHLDGYSCQNCKSSSTCYKQIQFIRLPNILVVHLKRFQYDTEEKGVKVDNNVTVPQTLSMEKYLLRGAKEDGTYQLCGVVEHTGQLDYGHYTATCLSPLNNKWYGFNDSTVTENATIFSGKAEFTSEQPYILFFSRKSLASV